MNAILSLAPRKNDQASILKFLNTPAASEAGPSSRRHTHTRHRRSPETVTTSPLKQYGPKNMTWTPTPPRGKGKGKA